MSRTLSEHLDFVAGLATALSPVAMAPTVGHVLATDALAELPVPPFTNSAMDGYLVRRADLTGTGPWRLPVVGDIPAGSPAVQPGTGEAVRIMTGAPTGEETAGLSVIPVELTSTEGGHVLIHEAPDRNHLRTRGENIAPGNTVMPAGTLIDAGALAALISTGVTDISAHPRPTVAVISSGAELVAAGETLTDAQLPDSNRPMIAALAAANGASRTTSHHTTDVPDDFRDTLDEAAASADLVITTGGISAGAYDVVKQVTRAENMWFGAVAIRPGAPQGAGRWGGTPLICLPGNPVAAFVSFHLFVVPVLRTLAGRPVERARVHARPVERFPTATDITRVVPVRLTFDGEITAAPFDPRGRSHLVASLADTHGLAILEPGADTETLDVILIDN